VTAMGPRRPVAFTLIELLVSMAIVSILLIVLFGMVDQASNMWRYSTSKTEQFRSARTAFESMTHQLSQATLNTYWDYQRNSNGDVQKYVRQSDLRFISGDANTVIGNTPPKSTKCVFFSAPLGFSEQSSYLGIQTLLNSWGYFIQFKSDKDQWPGFMAGMKPTPVEKYRYNLMEFMQPSEELSVYKYTSGSATALNYHDKDWFRQALSAPKPPAHILAENVVALVLLPKLPPDPKLTGTELAPNYEYDSSDSTKPNPPQYDPKNQLPPIVQVTLVAIDEASAGRLASQSGTNPPDFGLDALFRDATKYTDDMSALQTTLVQKKATFRTFTTNVSIRGAKWSVN